MRWRVAAEKPDAEGGKPHTRGRGRKAAAPTRKRQTLATGEASARRGAKRPTRGREARSADDVDLCAIGIRFRCNRYSI